MSIRNKRGRIEDSLYLSDARGRSLEDPNRLERLKLSVLLTKQFTYFLRRAPDPDAALSRFDHLLGEILDLPQRGAWLDVLTDPGALKDLARILGTSDLLWEDFIRLQYESLLPVLKPHMKDRRLSAIPRRLQAGMEEAVRGAPSLEEAQRRLNAFKDREIFLIDLDHLLDPGVDFLEFSKRLTQLAEAVVKGAAALAYDHLAARFGRPRTIGGLEARWAVLGLGKLGGAALGYASDIELLFVYADQGRTDGPSSLKNSEFFEQWAMLVRQSIHAKREGIFRVDLRLRPHGKAGPMACSLENFCSYYGRDGQAHAYEKLALVRLRFIAGDAGFGRQLERLRDELVYQADGMDREELRALRERQFREKTGGGRLNAKFSPGGLVDLEYGVQMLQVTHGRAFPGLRTPRIHESLTALSEADLMPPEEARHLADAYHFLRRLINGVRMLRGSAKDLFLPPGESHEFVHLARRMGYRGGGPLDPARQLQVDFDMHTATVRLFVERYFGRGTLPSPEAGTIVDLLLSEKMPREARHRILQGAHFTNPDRAAVNFITLAGTGTRLEAFVRLALLAWDSLRRLPDPDRALNNWERFMRSLASPEFQYNLLLSQPRRLDILLGIFSGSQFLSDALVRYPGFLDWVVDPEVLHPLRKRGDIEEELRGILGRCATHREWLNSLRRIRLREILRIGTRDICLGAATREVMSELSALAEAQIQVTLEGGWKKLEARGILPENPQTVKDGFCIMALGKLGGGELNYSSDIDLLGFWDDAEILQPGGRPPPARLKEIYTPLMDGLRADLSVHTEEGHAYRVDLRLRPFGRSGELVPSFRSLVRYYMTQASLWEIQASLKMRPVAGNLSLGYRLLEGIRPKVVERRPAETIRQSVESMRRTRLSKAKAGGGADIDVKHGPGGIRDIEFLAQGLQLIHAPDDHALLDGNTLRVLDLLGKAGILPGETTEHLTADYEFLRKVEHALQIFEDRQVHTLPRDNAERGTLARKLLGRGGGAGELLDALNLCFSRTREAYENHLLGW